MHADEVPDDFELAYACLFCGNEVDEGADDFCQLNFEARGGVGWFTCHVGCLRAAAHDSERFPAIETLAEPPPGYEPPARELLAAWGELADVLAQIQHAELADVDEVRSLLRAIEDAAVSHGVVIEHEPPRE
jgi:hypothetical protein